MLRPKHTLWRVIFEMCILQCKVAQMKKNTINSNTSCHREIKFVTINTDYYLLQFHALKLFLGVHLYEGVAS